MAKQKTEAFSFTGEQLSFSMVEQRERQELQKSRSSIVYKSNELIQKTRYDLSLMEQKILLMIMQKISPFGTEIPEIHFSVKEFCQLCGIDYKNGKNYINVKRAIKSLADRSFWAPAIVDGKKAEVLLRWLETAIIEKEDGGVVLTMNQVMSQYLQGLTTRFAKYSRMNVLPMKSKYSIRFYELFKSYSNLNIIRLPVEQLRSMLLLNASTFEKWKDFNSVVLQKAVGEINELTDIKVGYHPVKEGRKIVDVTFLIGEKDVAESEVAIERAMKLLSGE